MSVITCFIFTARRCASAVYAVVACPSVRLSQAGTVSKRLDESSWYPPAWGFLPPIPRCVIRTYWYLQKLWYFHLVLCPKLRT